MYSVAVGSGAALPRPNDATVGAAAPFGDVVDRSHAARQSAIASAVESGFDILWLLSFVGRRRAPYALGQWPC